MILYFFYSRQKYEKKEKDDSNTHTTLSLTTETTTFSQPSIQLPYYHINIKILVL